MSCESVDLNVSKMYVIISLTTTCCLLIVERLHKETSSFHVPIGEMIMRLDGFSCLLHLPIKGRLLDLSAHIFMYEAADTIWAAGVWCGWGWVSAEKKKVFMNVSAGWGHILRSVLRNMLMLKSSRWSGTRLPASIYFILWVSRYSLTREKLFGHNRPEVLQGPRAGLRLGMGSGFPCLHV